MDACLVPGVAAGVRIGPGAALRLVRPGRRAGSRGGAAGIAARSDRVPDRRMACVPPAGAGV
ncbi:MAG: hypothetical protein KIT14_01550 [bacterium]|nr:hypothetical protein [bacterium]